MSPLKSKIYLLETCHGHVGNAISYYRPDGVNSLSLSKIVFLDFRKLLYLRLMAWILPVVAYCKVIYKQKKKWKPSIKQITLLGLAPPGTGSLSPFLHWNSGIPDSKVWKYVLKFSSEILDYSIKTFFPINVKNCCSNFKLRRYERNCCNYHV